MLVVIPLAMLLLGIGIPLLIVLLPQLSDAKAAGVRFNFEPKSLKSGFDASVVERFVARYSEAMPEAFAAIGVKVTAQQLRQHFGKVLCTVKLGSLKTSLRSMDINNDGKVDTITGLTHSESRIDVGVLDQWLTPSGGVDLSKTAVKYELHNTATWRFAGYNVSMGEVFVQDDDDRLLPWLDGKTVADMKSKRAVLDARFAKLNNELLAG